MANGVHANLEDKLRQLVVFWNDSVGMMVYVSFSNATVDFGFFYVSA